MIAVQNNYRPRYLLLILFSTLSILGAMFIGCSMRQSDKPSHHKKVDGDTVTLLAYNVENLFDLVENGSEYPEYCPGRCNWGRETFNAKVKNISAVIAASQADIVTLCEIENENALESLKKELNKRGVRYKYSAIADRPNPTNTCPAILSFLPVVSTQYYGVTMPDSSFSRNLLEADIVSGDCTLKVFAVHWPSKINPESHRFAAAEVLLKRLEKLPYGTDYIITGDFNSNIDEYMNINKKSYNDSEMKTALHKIFNTVYFTDGIPVRDIAETDMMSSDRHIHYDLWHEIPVERRCSYQYKDSKETPDHILVPSSLYDNKNWKYIDNSFGVFRWNGRIIFNGRPYRWQMDYSKAGKRHVGMGYSDHLPIYAKFVCINP